MTYIVVALVAWLVGVATPIVWVYWVDDGYRWW